MRRYWFEVAGSGNFPFGMLAMCQCWPMNEEMCNRISLACPTVAPEQKIIFVTDRPFAHAEYECWRLSKWPIIHSGEHAHN